MGWHRPPVRHYTLDIVLLRPQRFGKFILLPESVVLPANCYPVQSLMAQGSEFPLRKPPGFHYDFFLLGITTFLAGLIGVPAPNGLIPQAPIHTTSLVIMGRPPKKEDEEIRRVDEKPPIDPSAARHETAVAVVEQRVSNLAQGALCLVLLTGPFLHVLNLIPRGVLAGLL